MTVAHLSRPIVPRVSVVVPARNEALNLALVLPELPAVHEVIVVDGHSVDDTVQVARRLLPNVRVVQQTRRGKGNALVCGFAAATGDIIVMFDADCSADPREIPDFVAALTEGADFAKGSRYASGGGSEDLTWFRSTGNRALNLLANLLMRTRYSDLCYGYNAFWADIVDDLELPDHRVTSLTDKRLVWGDGFEIETVLSCRVTAAGLRVAEVGSVERTRVHGESNLNAVRDGSRVLKTILTERRRSRATRRATRAAVDTSAAPVINDAVFEISESA